MSGITQSYATADNQLMLAAGSLIAVAAAAATLLYVPLSDRVSIVVLGALGIGGVAMLSALVAIRTNSFGSRYRVERVRP